MVKKTHHNPDYAKNKTADVIKKGSGPAIPNEYWQENLDLTPSGSPTPLKTFDPMPATKRPCMHKKVNECDN